MEARPIFPRARARRGMYESFYLRAYAPHEPLGVWIRHTVHKRPGLAPTGSVWCTVFDARSGPPYMVKSSSSELEVAPNGWISVGGAAGLGPGWAEGRCGEATWSLRFESEQAPLHHLHPPWLYRAPLPRTKLTSPAPSALVDGYLQLAGRAAIVLERWPGMVGHNWGAEHAERWIWLHAAGFDGAPDAWLDLALGRILIGRRQTPWVANGALGIDGTRHRIGGLLGPRPRVSESTAGCSIGLGAAGGPAIEVRARIPPGQGAGWRYADPNGGEHDVVNCSIAPLELDVSFGRGPKRTLRSAHGGAYELGMREQDHGVPLAPFSDG